MDIDINALLKLKQEKYLKEKERLRLLVVESSNNNRKQNESCDDNEYQSSNHNNNVHETHEDKENVLPEIIPVVDPLNNVLPQISSQLQNNHPLINSRNKQLDSVEETNYNNNNREAFIDKISDSDNPLLFRSDVNSNRAMLRFGEYSPNNPQIRVTAAAPYLGLGEYEQKRNYYLQKQKAEYLEYISKKNQDLKNVNNKNNKRSGVSFLEPTVVSLSRLTTTTKAVQTEIQNIHCRLIQYDLHSNASTNLRKSPSSEKTDDIFRSNCWQFVSDSQQNNRNHSSHNNNNYSSSYNRVDQRLTSAQNNALLKPEMDKPKSILSNRKTGGGSPRERLLADLNHSYTPSFMDGFSYHDRSDDLERERIKRESYNQELRLQIEEKRRLQAISDEQERRQQDLENRRLEQQLMRMQEEQMIEEQRRSRRDEQMRRHSDDLLRKKQEMQVRQTYRKPTTTTMDMDSSSRNMINTNNVASSSALSHYSPPVSRRNPYSFTNIPSTSSSVYHHHPSPLSDPLSNRYNPNRFDSYYRKDTLNRMDSLNTTPQINYDNTQTQQQHRNFATPNNSRFLNNASNRYDSLSRIDSLNRRDDNNSSTLNSRIESLNINYDDNYYGGGSSSRLNNVHRRHSATHQDLSMLRNNKLSPKLQRRSSSSRFDDTLPIPILKAHSPVAKELKNSIPFNSNSSFSSNFRQQPHHSSSSINSINSSSDAVRQLEDKWQIPAVQKNIVNHHHHGGGVGDGGALMLRDVHHESGGNNNRSILTQLGAIRMQLQQEQLRMDETLRKRDYTQSKAVDFH